jgi:hypothetical protein
VTYRPTDLVTIEGRPSSLELLEDLAAEGKPVLLAFSRGKDSISAWLAMRDAGIEVVPYFLYHIPGMSFVDESLAYFEDFFDTKIHRYPHPAMFRWLNTFTFQAPHRLAIIEAASLPMPSYEDVANLVREDLNLPGAWNAGGVRAADSPNRRMAMTTHGPRRDDIRKISIVWDWKIRHVREILARHQVQLPVDYEMFGRSWDGLDLRFTEPLRERFPADYELIRQWFPLVELEALRARYTR